MKVLLTGATGFLGFRTLEKLSANPAITQIIAAGRTIKKTHFIQHPKVTYELGDLCDTSYVEMITNNMDCIIHAAALSSPWGPYEDFEKANVTSQNNCLSAARLHAVKRYIYISSPSIYFNSKERINLTETSPLPARFINSYAATKHQAELALINAQLPYIILRPRAIIGRGDTVIMPRLIKAFKNGRLKIIGNGKNIVDLTSVANVAHAIELSLFANDDALNQAYNISNDEPVLLWESIEKMLNRIGCSFPKKKLPYKLVEMVAACMQLKSKLTNNKEPLLTTYGVGTLATSFTMDISKAKRLLQYTPIMNTAEAIEEFANWHTMNA